MITVENLGKAYRLGAQPPGHQNFREAVGEALGAPLRMMRSLGRPSDADLFWALRSASFEVKRGEVLGIIGRNGAGKSTLLKILSRITRPTEGSARLKGRVSSLLEVGTGFHPELTGRENIYLNGAILGMKRREIDRKFDQIVEFSEIEKFLDTPVKRYSSGMYVRLAFAVAAHLEPEILIVDEVLAVGDAAFQKKCLGRIRDMASGGERTVLFVSHNMAAVAELCGRVLLLDGGAIVADGEPGHVIRSYGIPGALTGRSVYQREATDTSDTDSQLDSAQLLNAGGEPAAALLFGEPFAIRMHWINRRPIASLSFSVRIFDSLDRLMCVTNTLETSELVLEQAGPHLLMCRIDPNVLVPGRYRVEIGAWVRPYRKVSSVENCLEIEVSEVAYSLARPYRAVGNPMFSLMSKWSQQMPV